MFTRKRTTSLFALAVGVGWLAAGVSFGQTLFEDDFDDDEIDTAKWRIDDRAYETGDGDYEAVEAGGVLTVSGTSTKNWWAGLALATIPTFTASADSPLTFEVERVSHETAEFFTLYPLGQNFTGPHQLRFDAWMNWGTSATTEFLGGGIGYNGTSADVNSGAQFITTGDGGSSADWRALKNGFYVSTGASYPAGSLNNSAAYYTSFLPSVNGSIAGAPGFQWITWEFNVDANLVTIYIEKPDLSRLLLISYDPFTPNVATTDGNISLFYADFFTSVSATPQSNFGLIDNVVVNVIPEPSTFALALLGGMGMFLVVRRRKS